MKWNEDGIKWDKMKRNHNAWSGTKMELLYLKGNENPFSELFMAWHHIKQKAMIKDGVESSCCSI